MRPSSTLPPGVSVSQFEAVAAWIEDKYELIEVRPDTVANPNEYLWRSGKRSVASDIRAFLRSLK